MIILQFSALHGKRARTPVTSRTCLLPLPLAFSVCLKSIGNLCSSGVQGSAKRLLSGIVNFVTAVAYHFFLCLPTAFTQPSGRLLVKPCTMSSGVAQTVENDNVPWSHFHFVLYFSSFWLE